MSGLNSGVIELGTIGFLLMSDSRGGTEREGAGCRALRGVRLLGARVGTGFAPVGTGTRVVGNPPAGPSL